LTARQAKTERTEKYSHFPKAALALLMLICISADMADALFGKPEFSMVQLPLNQKTCLQYKVYGAIL